MTFRPTTAAEQAGALQAVAHLLPISERAKGMQNDLAIVSALPRYDLERIRIPTLLISAEDDLYGTFRNARYTAEHIPGARFVGYPTGGHLLLGHWKEACAQVVAFLGSESAKEHSVAQ